MWDLSSLTGDGTPCIGRLNLSPFFFFLILFISLFWLCWVFVAVCRLSLALANGGSARVPARWLLVAVASLVAEPRLQCTGFSSGSKRRLSSGTQA